MNKKIIKILLSLALVLSMFAPIALAQDSNIKIEPDADVVRVQKDSDIGKLISNAITVALGVAGLLTFAFLVMGGIQWITSGGDKAQYEAARNRITYALVGLAIVVAAWALMQIVGKFFGITPDNIKIPTFKST